MTPKIYNAAVGAGMLASTALTGVGFGLVAGIGYGLVAAGVTLFACLVLAAKAVTGKAS